MHKPFFLFFLFLLLPVTSALELIGNGSETIHGRGLDCPMGYLPQEGYCVPVEGELDNNTLIIMMLLIFGLAYFIYKK